MTISAFALIVATAFALLALGWVLPPPAIAQQSLFWIVATFFVFKTVEVWSYNHARYDIVLHLMCAVGAGALALTAPPWLAIQQLPSPGLVSLAAFFTVLAAWFALKAWVDSVAYMRALKRGEGGDIGFPMFVFSGISFEWQLGTNMLIVLSSAAFIVYLAHLMS